MDRLSDYVHNLNLRDKRNMISSIASGVLFAIGWWIAIDAACVYTENEQLLKASHVCGAIGTIALIMVNSVTNNQIREALIFYFGKKGCFGKTGARIWIFLAFLMSFGSLIGSFWIFFDYYVSRSRSNLPGLQILLQNIFIFAASIIMKFGRSEDLWGN